MPAVMRAAAAVEKAGVPAVTIGATGFEAMGRAVARGLGVSDVPMAVYPGVILTDPDEVFAQKVREVVSVQVRDGLLRRAGHAHVNGTIEEPAPRQVFLLGDLDMVQERFLELGLSDGLPIVPPTEERVERFLRFTDSSPDGVLGILPPAHRQLSVWSIAAHGVMAGCRPEYMPVLEAVASCLTDPRFRIEDAGSTPGWEPLVVLSGAIADELDFNSGTGVMRVGRQANTSVGRFVRMVMRNVAGLRIPPGETDQGAIAYTFNVALPENEKTIDELGWHPYRVDRGFSFEEDMVSVQSIVNISAPIYSGGGRAEDHLRTIAQIFSHAIGPWAWTGVAFESWYPLLVLGPSIAKAIAADGIDKDGIRRYLYDNMRASARSLEECAWQVGRTGFDLAEVVRNGRAPAAFAESDDPERLVPLFIDPDWIGIVVAGNPSRNQSKAYVGNHAQGAPVAGRINRPRAWDSLLEAERRRRKQLQDG